MEEVTDDSLTTAGGWCAPSETIYDVTGPSYYPTMADFPKVSVNRGGIEFPKWTPDQIAAAETNRLLVARLTKKLAQRRADAVDAACIEAMANNFDVHVHEHYELDWVTTTIDNTYTVAAYVGIEFTPAKHPVPTIHYHRREYDDWYDN